MAAAVVQTQPRLPRPHFKPVIEQFVLKRQTKPNFDPKERLAYERPKEIIMMRDIGFSEDTGISPVAVSEPFSLFSAKAIHIFRDEVLSEDVIKNCGYKSNIGCMPAERLYSKVSRHRHERNIFRLSKTDMNQICTFHLRCMEQCRDSCDNLQDCWN